MVGIRGSGQEPHAATKHGGRVDVRPDPIATGCAWNVIIVSHHAVWFLRDPHYVSDLPTARWFKIISVIGDWVFHGLLSGAPLDPTPVVTVHLDAMPIEDPDPATGPVIASAYDVYGFAIYSCRLGLFTPPSRRDIPMAIYAGTCTAAWQLSYGDGPLANWANTGRDLLYGVHGVWMRLK